MAKPVEILTDIANAIREKDGTQELIPVTDYSERIRAIPQGGGESTGWQRSKERPPAKEEADVLENEIYMLFCVENGAPNDIAFSITAEGGYIVDWGDGVTAEYGTGTTAEHRFNYDGLEIEPDSNGFKWVYIKFSAVGNITAISHNVRPSWRSPGSSTNFFYPQIHEIYAKLPHLSEWSFVGTMYTELRYMERVALYGSNMLTSLERFMFNATSLRELKMNYDNISSFSSFLYGCTSYNYPIEINNSKTTIILTSFLYRCTSFNSPVTINCPAAENVNLSSFMSMCTAFNSELNLNFASVANLSYFLMDSSEFTGGIDLTPFGALPGLNAVKSFCYSCYKMRSLKIDGRTISSMLAIDSGFPGITSFRVLNMSDSVTSLYLDKNTSMSADAIAVVFGDLCDRTGMTAGITKITNTIGAADLTLEQRAIATNKNWTISG